MVSNMKVGYCQTKPIFSEKELNFKKVESLCRNKNADLLVLPELFNTGYTFTSKDEMEALAETSSGLTADFLINLAHQIDGIVVGGFVEKAEDVIDELRPQLKGVLREDNMHSEKKLPKMSSDEKVLYLYLSSEPKHIDTITRDIDITSNKALSLLLNLELKGIIRQIQGKHFSLN